MCAGQRLHGGDVRAIALVDAVGDIERGHRAPWRAARPAKRRRGAAVHIVIGKDRDAFAGDQPAGSRAAAFSMSRSARVGQQVAQRGFRKAAASPGDAARGQDAAQRQRQAGSCAMASASRSWPRDRGRPSGARSARTRRKERRGHATWAQGVPEPSAGRKGRSGAADDAPLRSAQRAAVGHPPDRAGLGPHQQGFGVTQPGSRLIPARSEPLVTPVAAKITSARTRSSRV
jgi:hypothetical protein